MGAFLKGSGIGTLGAIAALGLIACGGSDSGSGSSADNGPAESARKFEGAKREVAQTVERFEASVRAGDVDAFCKDVLAKSVVDTLRKSGESCAKQRPQLRAELRRYGGRNRFDIAVEQVEVRGSRATAKVVYSGGNAERRGTIALVKEGARWGIGVQGAE